MVVQDYCRTYRTLAAKVEEEIVSSGASEDENGKEPSVKKLTRQERKAMDREIPWRVIARGPGCLRPLRQGQPQGVRLVELLGNNQAAE